MLQAIIFDMDGVLCDSEPFITQAACDMFRERHQTPVAPSDFLPFTGTGEDRFLGGVAEKHNLTLRLPQDKDFTYQRYLELIQGQLDPLPGVVTFIAMLKQRGIHRAVASSADLIKVEGNLKQLGLPLREFDVVITGSDTTHKKPHPEAFLNAAKGMNINPVHCLVVEDAVSGAQAAKAAGAKCLGITTSFDAATLIEAGADWTAPDLAHVPDEALAW